MNKKKYLLIFLLLINCSNIFSQNIYGYEKNKLFQKDTTITDYSIFDYFRQEQDSIVYIVGSVHLMNPDSLSFSDKNEYTIMVTNPKNGYLEVYYKSKLLYKYMLINKEIEGRGFCYYPFSSNIALQGSFKEGKLHGLVFVQKENGEIIEVMKFKKGKYVKHVFHWLSFSKKNLRKRSKKRSNNPLRNDEIIYM